MFASLITSSTRDGDGNNGRHSPGAPPDRAVSAAASVAVDATLEEYHGGGCWMCVRGLSRAHSANV